MNMINSARLWLLPFLFFVSCPVFSEMGAEENRAASESTHTETLDYQSGTLSLKIKVRPGLCLRYQSEDVCELTVEIQWYDSRPGDYCLHSGQDDKEIQCWNQRLSAERTEKRSISEDLTYWLSHPGDNQPLVAATINIATLVGDRRSHKVKRRHIWNLI